MDRVSLQVTEDGSHTLFNAELNETYHSSRGAMAEAQHVFIDSGFDVEFAQVTGRLNILEIGFGTGLNALMTLGRVTELAQSQPANSLPQVYYQSLEPYPIADFIIQQLNYTALLPERFGELFAAIHHAEWHHPEVLSPQFTIEKTMTTLEQFNAAAHTFDLIYFDAFAPNKQPDVWCPDNMQKCFELLKPNGMLVSYCANGQFKRNLKAAGFMVKPHPGALGKREMTRAWKISRESRQLK